MRTVWKTVIKPDSVRGKPFLIQIPAKMFSIPISVGKQGDEICCWFEVETEYHDAEMNIYCVGTGFGQIPNESKFISTVIDGNFVWHFFYVKPAV